MTEAEWLTSDDWRPMLALLAGKISERKGTLYVCAGLRSIWDLLYSDSSREAVDVAERAADGLATEEEVRKAAWSAECPTFGFDFVPRLIRSHNAHHDNYGRDVQRLLEMGVYTEADLLGDEPQIGDEAITSRLRRAALIAEDSLGPTRDGKFDEDLLRDLAHQDRWPGGHLVREIFGNPFRPVTIKNEWLTWNDATVTKIAKDIYGCRDYDRLPILADALEEAGCHDTDILTHCRRDTSHARGCWALDALLGLQ